MRYLWLVLFAPALVATASAQTVLSSAVYNGHTYSLLSNSNWTDAEAKAVSLGGHLATVNDAAENQFIFDTFSTFDNVDRSLWIGLNDAATEGTFVWVSGESSSFRAWLPGQPDNANIVGDPPGEDYAHLLNASFGNAFWNDAPDITAFNAFGIAPMYGVVEVVPEPAGWATLSLGALALLRRKKA